MSPHREDTIWERRRQYVPNKRVSMLRLVRWRKMRRTNRRRKSMVAYWWAPLLACLVVGGGLFGAYCGLPRGMERQEHVFPAPGLHVVYVTQEQLNAVMREETIRRIAHALSDEDVGISLVQALPEPQKRPLKPIVIPMIPTQSQHNLKDSTRYLPPAWRTEEQPAVANVSVWGFADAALRASAYQFTLPQEVENAEGAMADFWIRLNASGYVVEVLRFAPQGAETPWLTTLRKALLAGRGVSAAQGRVRIYWDRKGEK